MTVGYRAFCATCLWDDGVFFSPEDAATALQLHTGDGGQHETGVENWDYQGHGEVWDYQYHQGHQDPMPS